MTTERWVLTGPHIAPYRLGRTSMTTRRGEPIETERKSVEDILRPLAEATVDEERRDESPFPRMVRVPDPRFEALRLRRLQGFTGEANRTLGTWTGEIDASLDAIVLAAAECGLVCELSQQGKRWSATVWRRARPLLSDPTGRTSCGGATPGEALAKALVTAVGDERLHSATEPKHG